MKHSAIVLAAVGAFSLAACTPGPGSSGSSSSQSSSSASVIRDVSYTGTIQEVGASIYMQGTHKLTLDNGQFLLLESSSLDLDNYLRRQVRVTGDVRPTVEEGGMIMLVESVSTVDSSSSEESSDESSSESSDAVSSATSSTSSRSSVAAVSSAPAVSSAAPASSAMESELEAKARTMAQANMGAGNWTQGYCSKQIGFCAPVHKNWWFTSFGATSTYLAHVEIGPEELESLGDGPLSINVVSGSVVSAGVSDGQVTAQGGQAVGYRAWSNDRHIEVRAPAVLSEAVRYITQNITAAPAQ